MASFTENIGIQPGDTANGMIVSEIDYVDIDISLTYEVVAIGIPTKSAARGPSHGRLAAQFD